MALLEISDLTVGFKGTRGLVTALDRVSLSVNEGEVMGLVGESGCGKSTLALATMGLISPPGGWIAGGEINFAGRDLLRLNERELRAVRGKQIAMVFQDAMAALNPVLRIERQLEECVRLHDRLSRHSAKARIIDQLRQVGIPGPEDLMRFYPHQLSGGLRQRVMIAMALACGPRLLIADEPTTALDVTVQAQVLDLIRGLQRKGGFSVLWITHDLSVVAGLCDRVGVIYAGQMVEVGSADAVYERPAHAYTEGLLRSVPRLGDRDSAALSAVAGAPPSMLGRTPGCSFAPRCTSAQDVCRRERPPMRDVDGQGHWSACWAKGSASTCTSAGTRAGAASSASEKILEVNGLSVSYRNWGSSFGGRRGQIRAVEGVSIVLHKGETLGIVGESGCGKSSTARAISQLCRLTTGEIVFGGRVLTGSAEVRRMEAAKWMQMVFQNPYSSLNPRMRVGEALVEAMRANGSAKPYDSRNEGSALLEMVGLGSEYWSRYPHELSGGQRQRVCIARALAPKPAIVVCDEPVSALDVSVQAQIMGVLREIQEATQVSYLFIAHDLSVVQYMSHRVSVMYLGRIVESGATDRVYLGPCHPYTKALLSAVPVPSPEAERKRMRTVLAGEPPSVLHRPTGCAFHPRCPVATDECAKSEPLMRDVGGGHLAACHVV